MNDENRKTLQDYIRNQLASGQTPDTVHEQVLGAGWPADEVQNAFYAVQAALLPTTMINPVAQNLSAQTPLAAGQRKGRIRTGWALFKSSLSILNGNRYLLRYLLMTGVWATGITAVFIVLYVYFGSSFYDNDYTSDFNPIGYAFVALDYVLVYFFINLYAAGLTANVLDIFRGQRKPYAEYMRIARSKAWAIFVYSVIESIVGLFLRYVVERIRFVGWILSWLLGTMWSLGTLFVIPIIVSSERPSGFKEIGQSIGFFKRTWGENITAKASVNVPIGLLQIALAFGFVLLIWPVAASGSAVLFWILFWGYFILAFILAVIGSFANSLLNIALYFFATEGKTPPAFSIEMLNQVFIKRKPRWYNKKNTEQPA